MSVKEGTFAEYAGLFGVPLGMQIFTILQNEHYKRRPSGNDVSDGVLVLNALEEFLGGVK